MIKDPYKFHFLACWMKTLMKKTYIQGLMNHAKKFLMELGQGFALYRTHYPIRVQVNALKLIC